jgi:uncharacterized protein (DUF2235 family)
VGLEVGECGEYVQEWRTGERVVAFVADDSEKDRRVLGHEPRWHEAKDLTRFASAKKMKRAAQLYTPCSSMSMSIHRVDVQEYIHHITRLCPEPFYTKNLC